MRVPLGELDPLVITLTIAMRPHPQTEDSDSHIGLTDKVAENRIKATL